jgi:hypothetical protein
MANFAGPNAAEVGTREENDPFTFRQHVRHDMLRTQERAQHAHAPGVLKRAGFRLHQPTKRSHRRVIEQYFWSTQLTTDGRKSFLDLFVLAYVGRYNESLST